ncbi:MAG TPA: M48 family metallopeptidase, partial [Pirellulaceae bacterium]|nr:M48 family metallopeptidase [Pirellulaceae bacterium]
MATTADRTIETVSVVKTAAPPTRDELRELLRQAFRETIQPVEVKLGYRIALVGVATIFLILVGIYFLLVTGLTLTLLNWLRLAFWALLQLQLFVVMWYSVPLIIGGSVWLALVKPLLSRADEQFQTLDLSAEQEPVFFEFVSFICRAVHALPPDRISVNLAVNASASFVGGWWDTRMRLTVGMPLILGLNARQLAGVIAHEFAHFRQRSGMRVTYVIHGLNNWFAQIAFERDNWDAFLEERAQSGGPFRLPFVIGQYVVMVVRLAFMAFVFIGHFLTANMLRQMEFDADRVEAHLVGSQVFAQTCQRLRLLNVCEEAAISDMDRFQTEKKLPDNLPALVVANVDRISPDKFREMERELLKVKTEWHDSHPSDRERIDNVVRERAQGIFTLDLPAEQLLSDPYGLGQLLTIEYYQQALTSDFNPQQVQKTDSLVQQRKRENLEIEAAERYFLGQLFGLRTLELPRHQLGAAVDPRQFATWCRKYRDELQHYLPPYALSAQREEQLREQRRQLVTARRWFEAIGAVPEAVCPLPTGSLQEIHAQRQRIDFDLESVTSGNISFRQLLGRRLADVLEMLRSPKVVATLKLEPSIVEHVNSVLLIWASFYNQREFLKEFVDDLETLESFVGAAQNDVFVHDAAFRASMDRVHGHLAVFPTFTSLMAYPFQHTQGAISVSQYLLQQMPAAGDLAQVLGAGV